MKSLTFKSIFSAFLVAVSITVFSCKDDPKDHPHPVNEATITITTPKEHSSVSAQDSVHITGNITASETLHGYTIVVRRKSDNMELFKKEYHLHSKEIAIDQKCLLDHNLAHGKDLELEVVTALDHDGNTATKKVHFHCMH